MSAQQAKSSVYLRWAFACGSLLLLGVITDLIFRPTTSLKTAAPQLGRAVAPAPVAENPEPAAVSPRPEQPEVQKPESKLVVPSSEEPKSGPDMVAPLTAQTSKPVTHADVEEPVAQEPALKTAAPLPEEPKSKPDDVGPPPVAQASNPKTEIAVMRPPEAQKSPPKVAAVAEPQLLLTADAAQKVGQKVWFNESAGRRDAITSWNPGEDFASLGIGHFIWFPAGKTAPFEETFPALIEFLRKDKANLPAWLNKTPIPPSPWVNRADFKKKLNSPRMKQLRQFLLDTVAEQTQFLVARAQGAIDKILEKTPDSAEREHIISQFARVVQASRDRYPLIDYINFKGEGSNPAETTVDQQSGSRQGWGLKQVLLRMNGTTNDPKTVLAEYADAAQFVLQRRVRNSPANRIWEAGWLHRVDTYRRPILDPESNLKHARNERPGARSGGEAFRGMNLAR